MTTKGKEKCWCVAVSQFHHWIVVTDMTHNFKDGGRRNGKIHFSYTIYLYDDEKFK